MEPLEIIGSIAGIVDISLKLSVLVGQFIQEVHEVPESLNLFNKTVQTLRYSLQEIVEVVKDSSNESEKQYLANIERISNDCYGLLSSFEDYLPKLNDPPSILKRLSAALEVKLKDKAIKEKLATIQSYAQSLDLSLVVLSIRKLSHVDANVSNLDAKLSELLQKIDALSLHVRSLLGDTSPTLIAPDDELARPGLPRVDSNISDRYNENIIAWRQSIINVTRDPSVQYSPATQSVVEVEHIPPGRNNSVTAEWAANEYWVISERRVKELTDKRAFLQAAKQQKQSIDFRQKLSQSRPFLFDERAKMEETRADLLLKCATVACWQEAMSILEGLLEREESLNNEAKSPERQGRLYLKLAYLLTKPKRTGRSRPDITNATRYLTQAMTIHGDLNVPLDEDSTKIYGLLIPELRLKGNVIQAEVFENWMLQRHESTGSSCEVSDPSSSISSEERSLATTTSSSTSVSGGFTNGDIGDISKAIEWCERLHLKGCPEGCQQLHCFPYFPNFRFDQPFEDGLTPFHLAIRAREKDVVKEMATEVCLADIDPSSSLLFLAAETRSAPIAEILVSHGATPHGSDPLGRTVLHRCQVGDNHHGIGIAEYFLEVNPMLLNQQDEEGRSALFMAVENGHRRMTQMLLKKGANANIIDSYGGTCLHVAVEASRRSRSGRSLGIVKSLIGHGANPNVKDNFDKRPLYLACVLGNGQIVDELLGAGADADGRGVDDETPLIAAVKKHHVPVVEKLVTAGADPTLRDKANKDAFSHATGTHRIQIRRALRGSYG